MMRLVFLVAVVVGAKPLSERLWEANADVARASLVHPWVLALATGDLDAASFAAYVSQDKYFLLAFSRSYGRAIGTCPDMDCVETIHSLLGAVVDELKLHSSRSEDEEVIQPTKATLAYTDFLDDVGRDPETTTLDILAAMAPCMALYTYVGRELKRTAGAEGAYSDWIDTYASDDFQIATQSMSRLIDRLYVGGDGRAPAYYAKAMLYEFDFFDAQARSDDVTPAMRSLKDALLLAPPADL